MVIQNLKIVLGNNKDLTNKDFVRNLLKEQLQTLVLNFIYTSIYRNLIFTGGTCLRKFYGLPRISEDLDFDIETKNFDFVVFQKNLGIYFSKDLQYKELDLRFKNQTLFLKFPVLREIGFSTRDETDILFLRLDFEFNKSPNFGTENQFFSAYDFSFLVKAYDFPTLIANKITAFLKREFKKGGEQKESFKGRDVFDLIWMLGEIKKTKVKVNLRRVGNLTGINDKNHLKREILEKARKISPKDLNNDLRAFFRDSDFLDDFCKNFFSLLSANIKYL